jgi:hypothetical protein
LNTNSAGDEEDNAHRTTCDGPAKTNSAENNEHAQEREPKDKDDADEVKTQHVAFKGTDTVDENEHVSLKYRIKFNCSLRF